MWGSGVVRKMMSRGLSVRVKVAIRYRHDLGDVPCLFLRRVNRSGKALRLGSSLSKAPSAARVSGAEGYCCCPNSSGGDRM